MSNKVSYAGASHHLNTVHVHVHVLGKGGGGRPTYKMVHDYPISTLNHHLSIYSSNIITETITSNIILNYQLSYRFIKCFQSRGGTLKRNALMSLRKHVLHLVPTYTWGERPSLCPCSWYMSVWVCVCVCVFWNLVKWLFSCLHVSRFPGITPRYTDKEEKGGFTLHTKKNLNSLSSFWRSRDGFLLEKSKTTSSSLLIIPIISLPPHPQP